MQDRISSLNGSQVFSPTETKLNLKKEEAEQKPEVEMQQNVQDSITLGNTQDTLPAKDSGKKVKVNVFPQDPFMGEPIQTEIEKSKIGKDLEGPRVVMIDRKNPKAIPDLEGNFFYDPVSPKFNQVNAFTTAYRTLDTMEDFMGRKIPWAFSNDKIKVLPNASEGANAYYSRWEGATHFMFFESKGLEKIVHTSQSADVVSHEMGHATLDGERPNYISSWNAEGRAFHEAFADIAAKFTNLSFEENIDAIFEETGGDLRKNNRLSMLGEEFGKAIVLNDNDPSNDNNTYLRNSLNNFKYSDPTKLPQTGPRETLTGAPHSFSRVFSGAFYDIITEMTNEKTKETGDFKQSLKDTRDVLGPLFLKSVDLAPPSDVKYSHIAMSMIRADEVLNNGENREMLTNIFVGRNILTPDVIKANDILPQVELKKELITKTDALAFLDENQDKLGVDASRFNDAKVTTDKYGITVIQYDQLREIPLNDETVKKATGIRDIIYTDVRGGMTIAFDKNGKLFSKTVDEIDERKIEQTVGGIKNAANKDLIRRQPIYKTTNLFKTKNTPYEAEVYQEPSGKFKLQRIPIIFD
jgi:Zn-dependent metalloprotease